MQAPPGARRLRLIAATARGSRTQNHEDSTRVDLLGDRHADAGRGRWMCQQRCGSPADDAINIGLGGVDRPDDKCVTNVANGHCDRRGDRRDDELLRGSRQAPRRPGERSETA